MLLTKFYIGQFDERFLESQTSTCFVHVKQQEFSMTQYETQTNMKSSGPLERENLKSKNNYLILKFHLFVMAFDHFHINSLFLIFFIEVIVFDAN